MATSSFSRWTRTTRTFGARHDAAVFRACMKTVSNHTERQWKVRIEKAMNIPLTYGGRAEFMIQNVLAATLACFVHGVSLEDLRVGLTTFNAGTAQTRGD